jgi:predicted amidohydrolase
MGRKLVCAAIQMDGTPAPVPERLSCAADLVTEAADGGARLVVLPEYYNTGFEFHEHNYALAERMDGQTVQWMKAQAARHSIHLAGTLYLFDRGEIYNAALLVAPDGRTWRYDKMHPWGWERAYFRPGRRVTVADTDLGKLGLMICADMLYADVWAGYGGKIQLLVMMNAPGKPEEGDFIFPDGLCAKYQELFPSPPQPDTDDDVEPDELLSQSAWLGVPAVTASATGVLRTRIPGLETFLGDGRFAHRAAQASEVWLETGFAPGTGVGDPERGVLAFGTAMGDGVVLAEVELPDAPPQPGGPQPPTSRVDDPFFEHMIPLYREGVRRQWGA